MSRILLENVTKIFENRVAAVSQFSLEIEDGCFLVIVGPSGCGKTTALRLIAGLEKLTNGNIYIGDTLANNISPKDRNVAMVFQNFILYPHMTSYQNMAFALKMRKYPRDQIKKLVEETAKQLGIEDLLHRKPNTLSGGQKQRVALGKAIVRKPNAFLFDEPLSNLDAKMRLNMRAELKELHKKLKTTTIYVTHDQVEAMTLGEKICVMYNGMIQQIGEPMEIYKKPANKFVAGFLGSPPMNFFEGRIEIEELRICFAMSDNTIVLPKSMRTALKDYHQKELLLGIRPEDISIIPLANQENNNISAKVEFTEPVGNRIDLYLSNKNNDRIIVSAAPVTQVKENQSINIYLNLSNIHIFEPAEPGRNVII